MTSSPRLVSLVGLLTLLELTVLGTNPTRAGEIACDPAERGVIQIDGLLDDWQEVPGRDIGGKSKDLSFTLKCNYDTDTLYLSLDVRDDRFVRTRTSRPAEDHVEVGFADGGRVARLLIYPADGEIDQKLIWPGVKPKALPKAAESRQPQGWSLELSLPFASLPEWSPGAPLIHIAVAVVDSDEKNAARPKHVLESAPLSRSVDDLDVLHFAAAKAAVEALLQELKLSPGDIQKELIGRVRPQGSGRVLVLGRHLAIIGDEFAYYSLPIQSARDIKDVRLADLAGDGHDAIVVRYRERGGGGVRDVLAAFRMTGEGFSRVFGMEVGKASERGDRRLETRVVLQNKTPKGARGMELIVEALPPIGWTEQTFHETAAEDLVPLPLPWRPDKRQRFEFTFDGYVRAE